MAAARLAFLVLLSPLAVPAQQPEPPTSRRSEPPAVVPLLRAHAHNDYNHERPLLDALDRGFCSVEADIHLVDGALLVAHDRPDVQPERTLQALYLDPLRERVRRNAGRVYRGGPAEFTLLIDVKSDAETTYRALCAVLRDYTDMLTRFADGEKRPGAVTVVISGNRSKKLIAAERERWWALDGRLDDTDPLLSPLCSMSWRSQFNWNGHGPMPEKERQRLRQQVAAVHGSNRRLRYWAIPLRRRAWEELHTAGVDLLNTDNLPSLQRFLLEKRRQAP